MIRRHRPAAGYYIDRQAPLDNSVSHLGLTRGPCLPGEWDCSTWIDVAVDEQWMDEQDYIASRIGKHKK